MFRFEAGDNKIFTHSVKYATNQFKYYKKFSLTRLEGEETIIISRNSKLFLNLLSDNFNIRVIYHNKFYKLYIFSTDKFMLPKENEDDIVNILKLGNMTFEDKFMEREFRNVPR